MIFVFRFPLNNQELLSRWLEQMRRTFWYPESTSYICSRHFTPDCFRQYLSGQYRLKEDAVPTIWNLPSNLARVSYLNKFHHNIYIKKTYLYNRILILSLCLPLCLPLSLVLSTSLYFLSLLAPSLLLYIFLILSLPLMRV